MNSSLLATSNFRFGKLLFSAQVSVCSYWILWNEPLLRELPLLKQARGGSGRRHIRSRWRV